HLFGDCIDNRLGIASDRHYQLQLIPKPLSGSREIEVVPFNRETVGESHASTGRMAGVAPIAGLEQHRVEHAEFGDFAADAVDFDPVAKPDSVAAHEHEPAEESDDEILEGNRQAGADYPQGGRELARHSDHYQQNDERGHHAQAHTDDAAQRLDLAPIQLWLVEQLLQPAVQHQQKDQDSDDDQRVREHVVADASRLQRDEPVPLVINARKLVLIGDAPVDDGQNRLVGGDGFGAS